MPIVCNFVNHASSQGLKSYFSANDGFDQVDWSKEQPEVASKVIELFDHQPADVQIKITLDLERIKGMTDEVGQAALLSTFPDASELLKHETAAERSLWVFQGHRDKFRQAEDIRYADQYRHGQKWTGYQVEASLPLHNDQVSMDTFKSKIKELFGLGEKVKIELFDRVQPDEEGNDINVVQVMIYQEGLPDSYLEFKGDEDIVSRIRRPVSEHAITYSSDTGTIEVVAAKQERRDTIAKAFTEDLLKQPVTADKVPLRRFDLMPLMENKPLDWDVEDGIESVQLVLMKIKDLAGDGRVQIEVPAKSNIALHEYAREHFGEQNPLSTGGFAPVQAKINIRFRPENGHGRGKVLPVKISMPNGCDLRSRTDKERLIGEKYLKRWGLLEEVQE